MDVDRHDQAIGRPQRIAQRGSSIPPRRVESKKRKKRDSTAQLFAQLAEQFVDQVKSSFAKINEPSEEKEEDDDDDDIILIDPNTSEPINKNGNGSLKVDERRVRIRGIPNRAASRVAEVLKNEFGITIFEAKRLDAVEEKKNSLLNEAHQPKSTASKASLLPMAASNVAEEDSSDDIEIIEIDETPNDDTIAPSSLRENGSEDLSDRIADENPANASKGLVITQTESTSAEMPSSTTPAAVDPAPASSCNGPTEIQPQKTCPTVIQCSPIHIGASQAVPAGTKPILRAQFFTVYQLTPVVPQSLSSSVVRELVKPTASKASSLILPSQALQKLSSIGRPSQEPESTMSESTKPATKPTTSGLQISGVKNSIASLLAQRTHTTSTDMNTDGLSTEVVNSILQNSTSISNFAINLMRHLFDNSELVASQSVSGQTQYPTIDTLDEKRFDLIHRLVREKAGSNYTAQLWSKCVLHMNATIRRLREAYERDVRLGRVGTNVRPVCLLYPKRSVDLKQSEFYAQNGLSYQEINATYHKSRSSPDFARKLMQLLFDQSELLKCQKVFGDQDGGLETRRVEIIRHIIKENSDFSDQIWRECVHSMNFTISTLKCMLQS